VKYVCPTCDGLGQVAQPRAVLRGPGRIGSATSAETCRQCLGACWVDGRGRPVAPVTDRDAVDWDELEDGPGEE